MKIIEYTSDEDVAQAIHDAAYDRGSQYCVGGDHGVTFLLPYSGRNLVGGSHLDCLKSRVDFIGYCAQKSRSLIRNSEDTADGGIIDGRGCIYYRPCRYCMMYPICERGFHSVHYDLVLRGITGILRKTVSELSPRFQKMDVMVDLAFLFDFLDREVLKSATCQEIEQLENTVLKDGDRDRFGITVIA